MLVHRPLMVNRETDIQDSAVTIKSLFFMLL